MHDPLGRILKRTRLTLTSEGWAETDAELYLYDGKEEIGALRPDGTLKNLRILGHGREPIAIELEGRSFATITDVHRNTELLIDPITATVANAYRYSAFGEPVRIEETVFNPWRYAGKRFDPDLQLIMFGKRFYDPELLRWLTPDPAGFVDSYNLYQYVFYSPFRYYDPDGQVVFLLVIPLIQVMLPTLTVAIPIITKAAAAGVIAYLSYKILQNVENNQQALPAFRYPEIYEEEGRASEEKEEKKPPHSRKELGGDSTKCPGEGYEWRGSEPPESGLGSWVKGSGKATETLHPDFNHKPPVQPYWDYEGPGFEQGVRLYLDGSWGPK